MTPRLSVKAFIRSGWLSTAAALVGLALALPSAASADLTVGSVGTGAGQYNVPNGVAVDQSSDLLYVADSQNHRIDVFDPSGAFLRAFGWGVADGASAEPQTCTSTCFAGLAGSGAGEFSEGLTNIAVDNDPTSPSYHDIYVGDGLRVQKLSPSGEFIAAYGGGVITGGAKGKGDLETGSVTVENAVLTEKSFAPGQTITGAGIPANTKIVSLGSGSMTLSKPATASGAGVVLSVAAGPGHVPVNEKYLLTLETNDPEGAFSLRLQPLPPSAPNLEKTNYRPVAGTSAADIEDTLEELASIDPGDTSVTGANGGPYTIEFKGPRYGDTNIGLLSIGGPGAGNSSLKLIQNGASAATTCTAAIASACSGGVEGPGEGQFKRSGMSLAVGPGGVLYVGDQGRVQKWSAAGAYEGQVELPDSEAGVAGLAVEPSGDFYVLTGSTVQKFDPSGNLIATPPTTGNNKALALDPAGNLFVGRGQLGEITEYNPGGEIVKVFVGETGAGVNSLAPYSTGTGDVFAVRDEVFTTGATAPQQVGVVHVPIPPPGPVIYRGKKSPSALNVSAITSTKATFGASINPEGKETTYHVEYVDQAHFEAGGFANPATKSGPGVVLPADFEFHLVSQTVTDLLPQTNYHFRVVASNADGADPGPEASFKTLRSFEVEALWATEAGPDGALLHAEVNPLGVAATAYFQYVDDATYQVSGFAEATGVPDVGGGKAPLNLGGGEAGVAIEAAIGSLAPATTYHYRLFTENSFGGEPSDEQILITFPVLAQPKTDCPNQAFRTAASASLPDCRAYELVSPVEKNGGDVAAGKMTEYGILSEVSTDGERATFSSLRPFGDAKAAPLVSQYFADRGPGGWTTHAIDPPRDNIPFFVPVSDSGQFKAFSEDLCSGWLLQETDLALVPEAPPGVPSLYRSDNCGEGSYELLSNVIPPGFGAGKAEPGFYIPNPQGFSTDGAHTVFRAPAKLTSNACALPEIQSVYVTTREAPLRLVSVLPNGQAACTHSSAGVVEGTSDSLRESSLHHAVSSDGSRVFWTATSDSKPGSANNGTPGRGPGRLFVRLNATQAQSKIAGGKCSEPEKACTQLISDSLNTRYWDADVAGARAIYTVGGELFEYDVEEDKSRLIAEGVKGVAGSSEDASRVYFVSTKALSGDQENGIGAKAQDGKPNLYLAEGGAFTYLGTLGSVEAESFYTRPRPSAPVAFQPVIRTSRVSPDGLHLLFTSNQPLSGYDNTDAVSGEPDTEVFLYDASPGAGAGQLSCVSCNPSGARPSGKGITVLGTPEVPWAAGRIPGWTQQQRPSRLLSADGNRLFFNAIDALVPRDTNGKQDVYEWQRASGPAQCTESGAELFAASSGGCLSLISSGQSGQDSEVIDTSKGAADVLIATSSSLLPQDPGLVDIYDARVGGGYPSPPTPQPSCEGEACQGPLAPPNDPTPGSSSFEGAGNVVEKHAKKKAHKKRANKKKQAKKKAHKSKQANHKRRQGR